MNCKVYYMNGTLYSQNIAIEIGNTGIYYIDVALQAQTNYIAMFEDAYGNWKAFRFINQGGGVSNMNTYYTESLGITSTTSLYPSYINKLTINIPSESGDYILEWSFEITSSSTSNNFWFRVRDNSYIYMEERFNNQVNYSSNGWNPICGFQKITLNGSKDFYVDFCSNTLGTTYIKNAKLLLRRII